MPKLRDLDIPVREKKKLRRGEITPEVMDKIRSLDITDMHADASKLMEAWGNGCDLKDLQELYPRITFCSDAKDLKLREEVPTTLMAGVKDITVMSYGDHIHFFDYPSLERVEVHFQVDRPSDLMNLCVLSEKPFNLCIRGAYGLREDALNPSLWERYRAERDDLFGDEYKDLQAPVVYPNVHTLTIEHGHVEYPSNGYHSSTVHFPDTEVVEFVYKKIYNAHYSMKGAHGLFNREGMPKLRKLLFNYQYTAYEGQCNFLGGIERIVPATLLEMVDEVEIKSIDGMGRFQILKWYHMADKYNFKLTGIEPDEIGEGLIRKGKGLDMFPLSALLVIARTTQMDLSKYKFKVMFTPDTWDNIHDNSSSVVHHDMNYVGAERITHLDLKYWGDREVRAYEIDLIKKITDHENFHGIIVEPEQVLEPWFNKMLKDLDVSIKTVEDLEGNVLLDNSKEDDE